MYRKIAVAYEDHPEAERAFAHAVKLAKTLGASLAVLAVAEPLPAYTAFSAAADPGAIRTLEQDKIAFYEAWNLRMIAAGEAEAIATTAHLLESSNLVHAIVEFTLVHEIDLLVVGLHKRTTRVSSLWSVASMLAQQVRCSILGVH